MRRTLNMHPRLLVLLVALGSIAALLGDLFWIDNFNW
jgi:hypothetical protein